MKKEPRGCGGYAWWSSQTCAPVRVYVYGTRPVSENTSYIIQLNGEEYDAVESDLFDTEEEALEVCIKRLDKEIDGMNAAVATLMRHRSQDKERLDALSAGGPKSWSTVTTSAVVSGSNTRRNNITVTGHGVLMIEDGAIVSHLTVKDHGSVRIQNAYANDVNVYSSSVLNLQGSSILNGASVSRCGEIWIDDAAEGRSIEIQDQGFVWVRSSGCVKYTKIRDGGFLSVRDDHAAAFNTTVSSGGSMSISAGAYIANCSVESGGELKKDSSCTCENLYVLEGGIDK